jgi:hypothetical protein
MTAGGRELLLAPETIAAVRGQAPRLTEEILAAVKAESTVYAEVLDAPEGVGIRLGIEQAIRSFLGAAERGERPGGETGELWRRLGEAEFQAGRSLEDLRAAWRTGTRAAWRSAAELAGEAGVPSPAVIALAEAIFVYTEELANGVFEAYIRMQSDEASERERRRRRLAALLLDPEAHDPETIARAAELARWRIPQAVAALALPGEEPGPVARRLSAEALPGSDREGAFILIPDPDGPGQAKAIRRAVAGTEAALGPAVPPREAGRSLRWARRALNLQQRGIIAPASPADARDHLGTMLLLSDEELARAFVSERLKAVEDNERLLETLEAWLDHQRHTPRAAAQLHVHPQTVRYRLGKLRELLGGVLERADQRFELELALRVRRALSE